MLWLTEDVYQVDTALESWSGFAVRLLILLMSVQILLMLQNR